MSETMQFQKAQIEALQKENKRLNDELRKVKDLALKLSCSDPIFDRPLTVFEINK